MQGIPVDPTRLGRFMVVAPPTPRVTPEGEQRRDRDGRPQWVVAVAVRRPERRAEMVEIVVPGDPGAGLSEGMPVHLDDLECTFWAVGDRSGLSWRASAVTAVSASAAAGSSGGGRKSVASGGER
ncbi:hypothetical protein D7319_02350 [Streptomyces radicis]|uniref:Regulatory protein n=1 Tax=Streptomyces radicis TaxID=1750517 RepID=A0A3A9WKH5_9ACTN|nr:hypothetical protein D7319_02350 [Streptomyces radicis]RKN27442.1 hypothetical protein D7318_00545 [Streptomyces radicis]